VNRSKVPLLLMEQMIMLLVFALAAALCVRAFVLADSRSLHNEARDRALTVAQNTAELYKSFRGDAESVAARVGGSLQNEGLSIAYDKDWQPTERETAYLLTVTPLLDENPRLGKAELSVTDESGETLITLPLAWQEVDEGA